VDEKKQAVVPTESGSELPVVRTAEETALEVTKILDLIAGRLQLETPHPATASRVRGARTVPREFVVSMIGAAERRPDLPAFRQFDSAAAREVLQSADASRLIAERTAMFLASLNYTIEARWADVVADAMRAFSIASILAEDPAEAELSAEVENLRKQLGRKRAGRKKKKAAKSDPSSE